MSWSCNKGASCKTIERLLRGKLCANLGRYRSETVCINRLFTLYLHRIGANSVFARKFFCDLRRLPTFDIFWSCGYLLGIEVIGSILFQKNHF